MDNNVVITNQQVIDDINSDCDNLSIHSGISDITCSDFGKTQQSGFNMNLKQDLENKENDMNAANNSNGSSFFSGASESEMKKLYKEFVKIMLKLKFEKIPTSHMGQKIPEKLLFKECTKREVPQENWSEYILEELTHPEKYFNQIKKDKKRPTKFQLRPYMDIINEEEF